MSYQGQETQIEAKQDKARYEKARHDNGRYGIARQAKTSHDKVRHEITREGNTGQAGHTGLPGGETLAVQYVMPYFSWYALSPMLEKDKSRR